MEMYTAKCSKYAIIINQKICKYILRLLDYLSTKPHYDLFNFVQKLKMLYTETFFKI